MEQVVIIPGRCPYNPRTGYCITRGGHCITRGDKLHPPLSEGPAVTQERLNRSGRMYHHSNGFVEEKPAKFSAGRNSQPLLSCGLNKSAAPQLGPPQHLPPYRDNGGTSQRVCRTVRRLSSSRFRRCNLQDTNRSGSCANASTAPQPGKVMSHRVPQRCISTTAAPLSEYVGSLEACCNVRSNGVFCVAQFAVVRVQ